MQFSPQSKVWVYQSNRAFTPNEAIEIQKKLDSFMISWLAHGKQLHAAAYIKYNFFIAIVVDENQASATGCSIDASVRFLKELENNYQIDLFNRFNITYKINDEVFIATKEDFETLLSIGQLNKDTLVFNNMVQTWEDFNNSWEVPMYKSWHQHIFSDLLKD